jgi:hypothetical protein
VFLSADITSRACHRQRCEGPYQHTPQMMPVILWGLTIVPCLNTQSRLYSNQVRRNHGHCGDLSVTYVATAISRCHSDSSLVWSTVLSSKEILTSTAFSVYRHRECERQQSTEKRLLARWKPPVRVFAQTQATVQADLESLQ